MDAAKSKLLHLSMYRRPFDRNEGSSSADKPLQDEQQADESEVERLRVPVFLNRNRRKMKQLRKHLWQQRCSDKADTDSSSGSLLY